MADFDIGDKVKHKVFGEGTITDIAEGNSAKLTILFDEIDDRMFLATVNYLIKIDMITTSVEPDPIAVNLPPSFQKVAVKWFEGDIPTADYFDSIQRLVDADAIRVVDASDVKRPIPVWVKNTAEAWASDSEDIDEDEYLISVNFLIIESMVKVPDTSEPLVSDIPLRVKKVAKSWTDGEFSDFEYIIFLLFPFIETQVRWI